MDVKKLARKKRSELEQMAVNVGLFPEKYSNKKELAAAILETQNKMQSGLQSAKIDGVKKPSKKDVKSMAKKTKSLGAGDVIESVAKATGIKRFVEWANNGDDCGCDERKKKANEKLPIRFKVVECFTQSEFERYGEFIKTRGLTIERPEIKFICQLYAKTFQRPYWEPCSTCSPKPLIQMIEKLDTVFEVYKRDNRGAKTNKL